MSRAVLTARDLPQPWISNCRLWCRRCYRERGGVVASLRSEYGRWRHWAWSPDGRRWFTYAPLWPKARWRWPFPPLWFRGRPQRDFTIAGLTRANSIAG